ncbi:patatin-like phospholipase family protein, partial [Mesorhizobium japonicum]|uniref:patatin-like phospholipase family protein n=1 Tax=Mesorhizobium japonicum TaxID=2066070 RepID=UPI003B59578D
LALSGGGANGAYGAGVLVGWSDHVDRPRFDVVTGVSTGALAAPFAYLGPDWDDELQQAYTSGAADNILSWRSFAAFLNPSLF